MLTQVDVNKILVSVYYLQKKINLSVVVTLNIITFIIMWQWGISRGHGRHHTNRR